MPALHTVVSLFSGCGGMDLGFRGGFTAGGQRYATLPTRVVWANDANAAACRTYAHNLDPGIRHGDVWDLLDTLPARADLVIGGFPCQDLSINGNGAGVDGRRSGLYRAMVEAVGRLHPRIFVAENVKALVQPSRADSLARVVRDFCALGYTVTAHLLNAADFGVSQTRERVFIVGTDPGAAPFEPPAPTHGPGGWVPVSRMIGDLRDVAEDRGTSHIWSRAKRSPHQGDRTLRADAPGQTIRAECHGNIQWHYELPRRISMREAARIQSFPDDFTFLAGLRETERMIGNAVPPVLAWHLARRTVSMLDTAASGPEISTG